MTWCTVSHHSAEHDTPLVIVKEVIVDVLAPKQSEVSVSSPRLIVFVGIITIVSAVIGVILATILIVLGDSVDVLLGSRPPALHLHSIQVTRASRLLKQVTF